MDATEQLKHSNIMNIKRLKLGQMVWIFNGEFPVRLAIDEIYLDANEVWLEDGNCYNPNYIYSTKHKCISAN